MLSTPDPPDLEPDAYTMPISAQPTPGEYGVHTFGREISTQVARLLGVHVDPPIYRENRWHRRPVPHASTFELTIATRATHTVLVTMFEVTRPLSRGPVTAYTISLDGQRLPFELTSYRDVAWQLARTIWTAVSDTDSAAARAAVDAAHDPPPPPNSTT
ncbi:hypothetical protein ACQP2P_15930 [Dactylosporangium sp. CA-139114]|uniref:hypothetical protein n=1 Tax=Dactylosporangium sp. CA-139114 TaxID=3239931 RepID=UPI003D9576D5